MTEITKIYLFEDSAKPVWPLHVTVHIRKCFFFVVLFCKLGFFELCLLNNSYDLCSVQWFYLQNVVGYRPKYTNLKVNSCTTVFQLKNYIYVGFSCK